MLMACCRDRYEAGPGVAASGNQPRFGSRLLDNSRGTYHAINSAMACKPKV
jgi:hypothetical protein